LLMQHVTNRVRLLCGHQGLLRHLQRGLPSRQTQLYFSQPNTLTGSISLHLSLIMHSRCCFHHNDVDPVTEKNFASVIDCLEMYTVDGLLGNCQHYLLNVGKITLTQFRSQSNVT